MIVTLFDTIGGFSPYNTLIEATSEPLVDSGDNYKNQPILDNGILVMPRQTKGLVMLSRYRQRDLTITWIGVYRPQPVQMSNRDGSYCGAGVFIAQRAFDGTGVIRLLDALVDDVIGAMDEDGPKEWKAKDAYKRIIDRQLSLKQIQKLFLGDATSGGISPSGGRICGVDLPNVDTSLGAIVDLAQNSVDFRSFQRLLITQDETAFLAINRSAVTIVNAKGQPTGKQDLKRNPHRQPPPAQRRYEGERAVSTSRPIVVTTAAAPPQDDTRFVDGTAKPRFTMAGVALALGIANTIVLLCALVTLQVGPRFIAMWTTTDTPPVPPSVPAAAAPGAADLRLGDASPKAGNGPVHTLSDQQFKQVMDTIMRLLSEEAVGKAPTVKSQLEQIRDTLKPPVPLPPNKPEGPK